MTIANKLSSISSVDSVLSIEGSTIDFKLKEKSSYYCPGWKKRVKSRVKTTCTFELIQRRFPIFAWLPTYNWNFASYDLIAGITVGLTTIPQCIAYAAVAGLPLQVKRF